MNPKIKDAALAAVPFIAILAIWSAAYMIGAFPKWLLPSPLQVASTFTTLALDGTLLQIILLSAANAVPAFLLALATALAIGTLIGASKTAKKMFHPFLSAIYPIPSLAWLPFIILFLGFTRETIWTVIFISSFMKMVYNVIGGVQSVDHNLILAAKNIGLKRHAIVLQVMLPAALPHIITGVRLGFGSAWRSLIGAEMLVVTLGGLGTFIWTAQWFFDFDKVLVGLIVIAVIGLLFEELLFKRIEKNTLEKWGVHRNYA